MNKTPYTEIFHKGKCKGRIIIAMRSPKDIIFVCISCKLTWTPIGNINLAGEFAKMPKNKTTQI